MNKIIADIGMSASEILANGYNPKRLEAVGRHFEKLIGSEAIHGAMWAIMHKGKLISNGAMGSRSAVDHSLPMKPDTYFRIASMTKIFTTAAIMSLVEDGILRLDAWVKEYADEFPHDGVTLWHLLTHTSGMYPDWGTYPDIEDKLPWSILAKTDFEHIDPESFDWLGTACSAELFREIGKEWLYCTFGFVVLGEVINRVTGQNVHDFITDRIIKPCGLTHTFWKNTPETIPNTYVWNEKNKEWFDSIIKGTDRAFDCKAGENKLKMYDRIPSTGGGLISTVTDMAKFAEVFLNFGRTESGDYVLGKKSVEMMTTEQLFGIPDHCWGAREENRRYGIGFDMRRSPAFNYSPGAYMHEGAGPSGMYIDPAEHFAAAWAAPFDKSDSYAHVNYTTQNVIWSGIVLP